MGFYLLCIRGCHHPGWYTMRRGAAFAQGVLIDIASRGGGRGVESNRNSSADRNGPRILTLLTTYNKRTAFAKANREAMGQRADGYESLVSVGVGLIRRFCS